MSTFYDIPAPAKINLFLHITGRRPDGYHLLQTVFRFIDLSDTLSFETRADGVISRAAPLSGVPEAQDLTLRAAHALRQATGTRQGVHIFLEKRIPQGGGLGGGSSDAATVLIALNRLWATNLSREELMALALPLGADVPVFIFGQSAFAEGVGEQLHALTLPEKAYLVAQPDASVPTADIFLDANLTRDSNVVKMADFIASQNFFFGKNDLEPVVYRKYPKVFKVFRWLAEHGISARMSGSGACLVAEYSKLSEAVLAEQKIVAMMRNANKNVSVSHPAFRLVQACPGLNEHPLRHWIAK